MGFDDWSEADRKALEGHLRTNYLLIPKSKLYQAAGGIVFLAFAAFGVSWKGALSALSSEAAGQARQRIAAMEQEAKDSLAQIADARRQAAALLAGLHFTQLGSVKAKRIALTDETGADRILLTTSKEGLPSLALYDGQGKKRVVLYANKSGHAGLALRDSEGRLRAMMITDPKDGTPSLDFKARDGGQLGISPHADSDAAADSPQSGF